MRPGAHLLCLSHPACHKALKSFPFLLPCPPAPTPTALDRAFALYKGKPEAWAALARSIQGDARRWSWDTAAGSYVDLYQQVAKM